MEGSFCRQREFNCNGQYEIAAKSQCGGLPNGVSQTYSLDGFEAVMSSRGEDTKRNFKHAK